MKSYDVTIQMKATGQYVPVALFIMQYKVVLTFESVTRHSHEVPISPVASLGLPRHESLKGTVCCGQCCI